MNTAVQEVRPIPHFRESAVEVQPGRQLEMIRGEAEEFRAWFSTTGMPDVVMTFDLVRLPYPTRFGFWRAGTSPAPFLSFTNRMFVVRWREPDGRPVTLLFSPSDAELNSRVPFYDELIRKTPKMLHPLFLDIKAHPLEALRRAGIDPEEVDYISYDHLHTQDVRRLIGTTVPAPDISPRMPVPAALPKAKLLVQKTEWDSLTCLHPLQQPWYLPDTYRHLPPDAIQLIEGDVLLGPGVALLATPGHTIGNHTLVLNTPTGIWAVSENVIATECLTPQYSHIPGFRAYADRWGQELVLNANTLEDTAAQYNSCVKEKLIVDRSAKDPRFLQFCPSSELTPNRLSPGTRPTFMHRGIFHGNLQAV